MQQQNHYMQNNKLCIVNTKKYEPLYNNIVRCTHHSQENKMHTSQHQCIRYDYRKPSLKIRLDSPETSKAGCKQYSILAPEPFHADY